MEAMLDHAGPEPFPLPEPITSAATRRPGAHGTPVEIAGQVWLLSDAMHTGKVWDDLYDQCTLRGEVDYLLVMVAAQMLLLTCHDITLDQAVTLTRAADPDSLTAAVQVALTGPPETHRKFTGWVRSALLASGINPDRVPQDDLREVLNHLVATGRAVPSDQWISSASAAAQMAAFRSMIGPVTVQPESAPDVP